MAPGDVDGPDGQEADGASEAGPVHCAGCGRVTPAECAGCLWEYDPPHYCTTCGTRLAVNVSPNGWKARCKVHGPVTPA